MAESYSVEAVLSAVDRNYSSTMKSAISAAESLGKTLTITGAAITAMGMSSLKSFGSFQSSLNKAAVTAGGTAKDIDGLADVANHMGAVLPISAQDAADAMVQMAQAGANVGTIKKEFPAIAEAATATGADLQATATTVQNAMNIWGDSLKSPQRAAAILTDTANLSNASIEDMSSALANVGGAAHMMGMSMQDTSTAIGLLTNRGFSAAQASQDLNHAILAMQAPSKVAANQMSDLGLSFTDAQGNMKPFPTILADINKALDGLKPNQRAAALKNLFGTAGMGAIAPLLDSVANKTNDTSKSWDAFSATVQKDSKDAATASKYLSDQAAEMQKNIGSKVEQVGGNWEALRNTAMSSTSAINGALLDMINNVLEWATTSKSGIAEFTRGFIGLMPVIGPAVIALGSFLTAATKIKDVIHGMGGLLTNPWILAAAAIAVLVIAFAKIYSSSEQLRNAISAIGNAFSSVFGPVIDAAKQSMSGLSGVIDRIAESVGNQLAAALNSVNWTAFFGAAQTALMGVVHFVQQVISFVSNMANKISSATGISKAALAGIAAIVATLAGVFIAASGGPVRLVASMLGLAKGTKGAGTAMSVLSTIIGSSGRLIGLAGSGFKSLSGVIGGGVISSLSKAGTAFTVLASPLGGLITKVTGSTTAVGALGSAGRLLGVALSAVSGPIGLLIGAITLLTAGIALTGGSFDTVIAKVAAFGQAFVTAAPIVGTAFGQIIQGILTAIATAIPGVMAGFITLLTSITTAIVTYAPIIAMNMTLALVALIAAITTQIPTIAAAATQMIVAFITAITAAIPQIVPAALLMITTFILAIAANIGQVVDAGALLITNFLLGIANNMQQIVDAGLKVIIQFLLGVAQNISGVVKAGMDVIINMLNGIASRIEGLVTAGVNVIVKFLNGIANNMGSVINAGVNVIVKFLNGIANNIGRVVTAGVNLVLKLTEAISQRAPQMGQAGANLIIALVKALVAGVAQLARAGLNLARSAIDAVRNKAGDMISAGANFVNGFVRGITGAIGGAVRAAANMAKSALNAAKSALGIHSPSRVMKKEVGYYTVAGLAVGILDNLKLVTDAAKQLAGAAVPDTPTVDFEASYDASNLDNFIAGTKKLQSNLQAAVSSQVNYTEQKRFTVEVPVNLDGQEVARITAEPMESELAKRSQRTNRIYGRRS